MVDGARDKGDHEHCTAGARLISSLKSERISEECRTGGSYTKGKRAGELLSKFHHVGVLVKNLDDAIEYYQALGIGPFERSNLVHTERKVHGKTVTDVRLVAKGTKLGPIGFELIQPVSGASVQKEWLDSRGEGINHIAFIVDDIEEATSMMVEKGFRVISSSKNEGGGGMALFDTDRVGGVQIELEELPPHLEEDPYWGIKPWNK